MESSGGQLGLVELSFLSHLGVTFGFPALSCASRLGVTLSSFGFHFSNYLVDALGLSELRV